MPRQLKDLRQIAGLTQAELADRTSMTRQNISRIECGGYMSFAAAKKLSSELLIEALQLFVDHNLAVIHERIDAGKENPYRAWRDSLKLRDMMRNYVTTDEMRQTYQKLRNLADKEYGQSQHITEE